MSKLEDHFGRWKNREEIAEAMIPMIGRLQREKNVTTTVYSRSLVNKSVIQILKAHRFVKQIEDSELSVVDTFPVLQEVAKLDLGPCRIDIGKLAVEYKKDNRGLSIEEYVRAELAEATSNKGGMPEPTDVVLYGFGRIGRILARLLIEKVGSGNGLRLKAIVVRESGKGDLQKRASLLRRDSVHGPFAGTIAVDEEENAIIANGNFIKVIYSNDPNTIDYTQYGINNAVVIDNTGKWRDVEGLSQHLNRPGVSRVMLTAPGKGGMKTNRGYGDYAEAFNLPKRETLLTETRNKGGSVHILDSGCGKGYFLTHLNEIKREDDSVTGFDMNKQDNDLVTQQDAIEFLKMTRKKFNLIFDSKGPFSYSGENCMQIFIYCVVEP